MSAKTAEEDVETRTVVVEKDVPACPECGRFNANAEFLKGWESHTLTTLRCPGCWYVFDTVQAQSGNVVLK